MQVHTPIWGPRECFNGNAHGRTYLLVSPHPPIDTLDDEIKKRFRRADDVPIITPGYLNSYLGPQIIVPTGIGFDSIKPRVGNNDVIVCLNDDELIEKFGTQIYPDEMSDDVLLSITKRFTNNHNPHMDPSMTFALGFSNGGSLTCYQYQNKQFLIHLPLDIAESTRTAAEFGDPQVDPALAGKFGVGRGDFAGYRPSILPLLRRRDEGRRQGSLRRLRAGRRSVRTDAPFEEVEHRHLRSRCAEQARRALYRQGRKQLVQGKRSAIHLIAAPSPP